MKAQGVSNYPSFSTQNQGFFTRHMRRISSSLPSFHAQEDDKYADKEKLGRGRWNGPVLATVSRAYNKVGKKTKIAAAIILGIIVLHTLFYWTREFWICYSVLLRTLTDPASSCLLLEKVSLSWWWFKVRSCPCSQHRWRSYGVERSA